MAAATDDGTPIFHGRFMEYLSKYPELGYPYVPISNGHSVETERLGTSGLPDGKRFRLLLDAPILGGEIIEHIWDAAADDPSRQVKVVVISTYHFAAYLVTVDSR